MIKQQIKSGGPVSTAAFPIRAFEFVLVACLVGCLGHLDADAHDRPPNLVLIVADDLGYGDLACYGNAQIETPCLDRLAAEGIRFTDFHSNGSMCTPTRVALLTGRYQQRFGEIFEGPLSGKTQRDLGLPLEAVTLAEALRSHGYMSGMFGKWHLGYKIPFLPTRQGFDRFVGLTSGDGDHHSHVDRSGNLDWWQDEAIVAESGYTADLLAKHAIQFIEDYADRPFFLYVPHLAIHFPWQGPNDPPHRVVGQDYETDKWGKIKNRDNVRPHVHAMVEALDRSVAQIIKALEAHQLDSNTLVLFLSDNGGYRSYGSSHHRISSNGVLRGQKGDLYEGGHRVPAIAWWPSKISASVCHDTLMTMDVMPTFLELAADRRATSKLDGTSFASILVERNRHEGITKEQVSKQRLLFWRVNRSFAVRDGPWKLVAHRDERKQLFNLSHDLSETRNLAELHPDRCAKMIDAFKEWETATLQNR